VLQILKATGLSSTAVVRQKTILSPSGELRPQRLLIVDATDMGLNQVKSALSIPMTLPRCVHDDHP
jgi:hypothetical protein